MISQLFILNPQPLLGIRLNRPGVLPRFVTLGAKRGLMQVRIRLPRELIVDKYFNAVDITLLV